ncbi:MAG: ribosome silencing factor [Pseudomonadota bacterium]
MEHPVVNNLVKRGLILPIATNVEDLTSAGPQKGVANQPIEPEAPSEPKAAIDVILESLEESKAQEIVNLDITGKSSLADHMVVASGRSHRHVGAIADQLLRALKNAGHGSARVEGLPHCDWVLVDAGDVIAHIFRPEVREFYNIEKMWSAGSADTVRFVG